ncbi:MAG: TM2 domain-containing protein [Gemmatimonadales bacterium]
MTGQLPDLYEGESEDPSPEVSPRSRGLALCLGVLGGVFGFHRFYAGKTRSGVAMLLTLGGLGIWWLYDMILLLAGEFRDAEGRPIRHWELHLAPAAAAGSGRDVQQLMREMERLRGEVGELAERLDFAERMLAQQRERKQLK